MNTKKIIKDIKHSIDKTKLKKYNVIFKNKQMKFILSKLILFFTDNEVSKESLVELETNLIEKFDDVSFWEQSLEKFKKHYKNNLDKINWKNLGIFLYYVFHYSEFYNKKSVIKNMYTIDNYNEINKIKLSYYNKWILELYDLEIKDFNKYIIKVLEYIK